MPFLILLWAFKAHSFCFPISPKPLSHVKSTGFLLEHSCPWKNQDPEMTNPQPEESVLNDNMAQARGTTWVHLMFSWWCWKASTPHFIRSLPSQHRWCGTLERTCCEMMSALAWKQNNLEETNKIYTGSHKTEEIVTSVMSSFFSCSFMCFWLGMWYFFSILI